MGSFTDFTAGEKNLFFELSDEAVTSYGFPVKYIIREIVARDMVLNEDIDSEFRSVIDLDGYFEDADEWGGDGDLLSQFGLEIRDETTIVLSRKQWDSRYAEALAMDDDNFNHRQATRPLEGDLLYIPFSKSLFEIQHVEHESPFYQIADHGSLPSYRLTCTLFEYNAEEFETEDDDIDSLADGFDAAAIEARAEAPVAQAVDVSAAAFQIGQFENGFDPTASHFSRPIYLDGGNLRVYVYYQFHSYNEAMNELQLKNPMLVLHSSVQGGYSVNTPPDPDSAETFYLYQGDLGTGDNLMIPASMPVRALLSGMGNPATYMEAVVNMDTLEVQADVDAFGENELFEAEWNRIRG